MTSPLITSDLPIEACSCAFSTALRGAETGVGSEVVVVGSCSLAVFSGFTGEVGGVVVSGRPWFAWFHIARASQFGMVVYFVALRWPNARAPHRDRNQHQYCTMRRSNFPEPAAGDSAM